MGVQFGGIFHQFLLIIRLYSLLSQWDLWDGPSPRTSRNA